VMREIGIKRGRAAFGGADEKEGGLSAGQTG
jgi:hypothetical protein